MSKYNKLTERLLAEGYTADNHPDYVRVSGGSFGHGDPLDNIHGGFEYTRKYRDSLVFKTGCGLYVKGSELGFGFMSYMGIDWIPENNNPVITCPMRPSSCDKRYSQILGDAHGGGLAKIFQCDLRMTDEPYDYEHSIAKCKDDEAREQNQKYEDFRKRVHDHVCHWHMHYNYWDGKWYQKYDPTVCARMCQHRGGICDLTHKELSKKRGNVFYDVRITKIHNAGDLFDGQEEVSLRKGIRFLSHPTSITICEEIAKRCRDKIEENVRNKYCSDIVVNDVKVEVLNIRAEQRESRDLLQDLADLKEGIKIVYESDNDKQIKQAKKNKRAAAMNAKIAKLEKKLLEVGYENLEEHSLDKIHADRWLDPERLEEIAEQRRQMLMEEKNKPKQMTLFDFIGGEQT